MLKKLTAFALFASLLAASTCWAVSAPVYFTRPTGGTYRLYPLSQSLSGPNWTTYAVTVTEVSTGRYNATLDTVISTDWVLFEGSSQPASFEDALTSFSVLDANIDDMVGDVLEDTSITLDDLVDDLEARLTAIRAGYFDKLNITGNVASQGSVDDVPTNAELATAIDPLPTANENRDAIWGATRSSFTASGTMGQFVSFMHATLSGSGVFSEPALAEAPTGGGGSSEPDNRDLEAVDHVFQLRTAGDGTLESPNPFYVHPGDGPCRFGFNCNIPKICPAGSIVSTQGEPSLVTASDDIEDLEGTGHDQFVPKGEFDVADDAEPTDDPDTAEIEGHKVKMRVTNDNGGSKFVYGLIVVQAEPE